MAEPLAEVKAMPTDQSDLSELQKFIIADVAAAKDRSTWRRYELEETGPYGPLRGGIPNSSPLKPPQP
jgi:hypothetical protein